MVYQKGLTNFMRRKGTFHCAAMAALSFVGRDAARRDIDGSWAMPCLTAAAANNVLVGEKNQFGPEWYHQFIHEHTPQEVIVW